VSKKVAATSKGSTTKPRKTSKAKAAPAAAPKSPKKSVRRPPSQFLRESSGPRSGQESGDLQGLSDVESVDSESVDELLEEGNAFEAGIVSGVEDSEGREGQEVRTREVPEDDVPGEYLDED
jgi:hypothetical protein